MKYVLNHEGKPYAKIFEDISAIPRGSFKEEKIADYVCQFAENLGLQYTRDEVNNIVVRKPATPGYEDHETVMLQGHMDMIWSKRPGSTFDFETEGIKLRVTDDGFLMAEETTCGSDDGVAVAYMMAILQDNTLKHPELECVFTTAEEPGLYGVQHFDCSQLKARKYISMDGNLEGTSLMISSGCVISKGHKAFHREAAEDCVEVIVRIFGLTGGHVQFAERQLANAIKVMARALFYVQQELPLRLVDMEGGSPSVIPTSCTAKIAVLPEYVPKVKKIIHRIVNEVKFEHKESDPNLSVEVTTGLSAESAIPARASKEILCLLHLLPSGLIDTSLVYPNLPISSACVESISTTDGQISWLYRAKSAITSKMMDMDKQNQLLCRLFGCEHEIDNCFYGHSVEPGSPLYNVYDQVWTEMTGNHIKPIGAHYGNEIGFFLEKMPWLDVVLLVATHYQAHTPDEKLDLASFDRCYKCLVEILARI